MACDLTGVAGFFELTLISVECVKFSVGYFVHLILTNKDPEYEKASIDQLVSRKLDGAK
jgi:hypothetical protein